MARNYRREKLAKEPSGVRGWRTIAAGAHRVRLALLASGKTRATSLLHPKGERNPKARHAWCLLLDGRTVDWYATRQVAQEAARRLRSTLADPKRSVTVRYGAPRPGIVVHSVAAVHTRGGGHRR